jgi:hypothetical protein
VREEAKAALFLFVYKHVCFHFLALAVCFVLFLCVCERYYIIVNSVRLSIGLFAFSTYTLKRTLWGTLW